MSPASHVSPRVSIGMPVFNGEATLEHAMRALLAQDFDDFELIISDNASTDRSIEIVQDLARRDPRIRLHRQPHNVGANPNYNGLIDLARGTYFKWASANDWCEPSMIGKLVAVLDDRPDVVLAYPRTRLFEQHPEQFHDCPESLRLDHADPTERMTLIWDHLGLNNMMNGLIRLHALRQTARIGRFMLGDVVLMGELMLHGKAALLDEPLFYRRMDEATATRLMGAEGQHRHHYPDRRKPVRWEHWRSAFAWPAAVLRAPLSPDDRWRALLRCGRFLWWTRHELLQDVQEAWRGDTHKTPHASPGA